MGCHFPSPTRGSSQAQSHGQVITCADYSRSLNVHLGRKAGPTKRPAGRHVEVWLASFVAASAGLSAEVKAIREIPGGVAAHVRAQDASWLLLPFSCWQTLISASENQRLHRVILTARLASPLEPLFVPLQRRKEG